MKQSRNTTDDKQINNCNYFFMQNALKKVRGKNYACLQYQIRSCNIQNAKKCKENNDLDQSKLCVLN